MRSPRVVGNRTYVQKASAVRLLALGVARACTPAGSHVEPTPLGRESNSGRAVVRSGGHPLAKAGSAPSRQRQAGAINLLVPSLRPVGPFEDHLTSPRGRGTLETSHGTGAAGGAPCGDLIRIDLAIDGEDVARAS